MSDRNVSNRTLAARTPQRPFVNPRGAKANYPWSVIQAPLAEIDPGRDEVIDSSLLPGSVLVALFCSDVPVYLQAVAEWPAADFGAVALPASTYVTGASLTDAIVGANLQTAAAVEVGEQSRVTVTPSGVSVPAYAVRLTVTDLNLLVDAEPASTRRVVLSAICESGVVAGSPRFGASAGSHQPIILAADDYTAAIRDNENVFVNSGVTYVVVGLWTGLPTP